MLPARREVARHLARLAVPLALLAGVADRCDLLGLSLALVASLALFMAAFAFAHDAAHGSLGLGRRGHAVVLGVTGTLMFWSGHAMRIGHAHHHADPLGPRDVEGAPARGSLLRALAFGPLDALRLRASSLRRAPRHERRVQALESAASAAFLALCASTLPGLAVYAIVGVALRAWMGAWAAWVPHNAPAWVIASARRALPSSSVVMLSLAYHDRHHDRPGLPCARLASAAA